MENNDTQTPDTCSTCKRLTLKGEHQRAQYHKLHPISGVNLARPMSEVIAEVRGDFQKTRMKLDDLRAAYPGWRDAIDPAIGLITCGLIALHYEMEKMAEVERGQRNNTAGGERITGPTST